MHSYARRDLVRNPRRTLATLIGVTLGVGLFSGVLYFIDASVATMTQRALAPLTLDLQRVVSSPLGRNVTLSEKLSASGPIGQGADVVVTLTVANHGEQPANEVVVKDVPPEPLVYVPDSTIIDGEATDDVDGQSPLAHGPGRIGLNIGTVTAGQAVTITYVARVAEAVGAGDVLSLRGTVSTREAVVPIPANAPEPVELVDLASAIAEIPGVAAADALSFVDLPGGSLHSGERTVPDPLRVFAFDQRYIEHYPSIRLTAGSIEGGAVLSVEAAATSGAALGGSFELHIAGASDPVTLVVSGLADLSRATPLFSSRKSSLFEEFHYLPNAVIVSPATFDALIAPAFRADHGARGSIIRNEPVREVDVRVDRSQLPADPGDALGITTAVANSIDAIAPGQDHLIDNISNVLAVAVADAAVGKRMFVLLGLPASVLAAVLASYAASIHARAQRHEQATLRLHGADERALLRVLLGKSAMLAGAGAVVGTTVGYVSVLSVAGRAALTEAPAAEVVRSALLAMGVGALTAGLALYLPGRLALGRTVVHERRAIELRDDPWWRRHRLDIVLVTLAILGQAAARRAGAFDTPVTSVAAGDTVSLPAVLLLAPITVWLGGVLVCVRGFRALTTRLPVSARDYGGMVGGTVRRMLTRRPRESMHGITGVGLVLAFGIGLSLFATTYDQAKVHDARFALGGDLRITPGPEADSQP